MAKTIEFVKHYQAHLGAINSMVLSPDSLKVITSAQDKMIKFFEVISFDMINMISVNFVPTATCWLSTMSEVAVADAGSSSIFIFKSLEGSQEPLHEIKLHSSPVVSMALNKYGVIVSADQRGMIEYWDSETLDFPTNKVQFQMKTETDLYDLVKVKTSPCSVSFSPDGNKFVVMCRDKQIRVFDFKFDYFILFYFILFINFPL
jgi:peptidylprolyl isomerase domain and WD repeat-containing protein 1